MGLLQGDPEMDDLVQRIIGACAWPYLQGLQKVGVRPSAKMLEERPQSSLEERVCCVALFQSPRSVADLVLLLTVPDDAEPAIISPITKMLIDHGLVEDAALWSLLVDGNPDLARRSSGESVEGDGRGNGGSLEQHVLRVLHQIQSAQGE